MPLGGGRHGVADTGPGVVVAAPSRATEASRACRRLADALGELGISLTDDRRAHWGEAASKAALRLADALERGA